MYKIVPIKYSMFMKDDNPIFGESVTHIYLEDDAGGAYIVIEQNPDEGPQKIKLDLDELIQLSELAINMVKEYDEATRGEKE